MGFERTTDERDVEYMEILESASLTPHQECHRCSSTRTRSRTRHVFKTIVLLALAYICFLETNIRLAVQRNDAHFHPTGDVPYCKILGLLRMLTLFRGEFPVTLE